MSVETPKAVDCNRPAWGKSLSRALVMTGVVVAEFETDQQPLAKATRMPEPFKNFFNPTMIAQMGGHLGRADETFDAKEFVRLATTGLEPLELKQRADHIRQALETCLPPDYRRACDAMLAALHVESDVDLSNTEMDDRGIRGWAIMPMADYVASKGLDDFDFSMDVLRELTKRSTSELAVRAFFLADTERALRHAIAWANDPNFHVRRLASEGSRPRLPWALRLPMFVENPSPVLPILEALRDDPVEYVRRSVANNLNDIAKDHPDLVAGIASRWFSNAGPERRKLVRHACRTLIKQGHPATLEALGYSKPILSVTNLQVATPQVAMGGHLEFAITVKSEGRDTQPLIIDYVIHHRKANGSTSPKIFKWKVMDLPAGKSVDLAKKHSIKPITTRVYYSGIHHVEIQINGERFARADFELSV